MDSDEDNQTGGGVDEWESCCGSIGEEGKNDKVVADVDSELE